MFIYPIYYHNGGNVSTICIYILEEDGKSWLRRPKLYKGVVEPYKKKKKKKKKKICIHLYVCVCDFIYIYIYIYI